MLRCSVLLACTCLHWNTKRDCNTKRDWRRYLQAENMPENLKTLRVTRATFIAAQQMRQKYHRIAFALRFWQDTGHEVSEKHFCTLVKNICNAEISEVCAVLFGNNKRLFGIQIHLYESMNSKRPVMRNRTICCVVTRCLPEHYPGYIVHVHAQNNQQVLKRFYNERAGHLM